MGIPVVCSCGSTNDPQDESCEAYCRACGKLLQVGKFVDAPPPQREKKKSKRSGRAAATADGTLEERIAGRAEKAEKARTRFYYVLGAACFVLGVVFFFLVPYLQGPPPVNSQPAANPKENESRRRLSTTGESKMRHSSRCCTFRGLIGWCWEHSVCWVSHFGCGL